MVESWAELAARLRAAGAEAFWQDLDGAHLTAFPEQRPPTSIIWAWTSQIAWRVRLDDDTAFVASCPVAGVAWEQPKPWSPRDGRMRSFRPAPDSADLSVDQLALQMWTEPLSAVTSLPVTFFRRTGEALAQGRAE